MGLTFSLNAENIELITDAQQQICTDGEKTIQCDTESSVCTPWLGTYECQCIDGHRLVSTSELYCKGIIAPPTSENNFGKPKDSVGYTQNAFVFFLI